MITPQHKKITGLTAGKEIEIFDSANIHLFEIFSKDLALFLLLYKEKKGREVVIFCG